MKNRFRGFGTIFKFTLKNQFKSKKFLTTTIIIGLLCLLIPAGILIGKEAVGRNEKQLENGKKLPIIEERRDDEDVDFSLVETILMVDQTRDKLDLKNLKQIVEKFAHTEIQLLDCGEDMDMALSKAKKDKYAVIFLIEQNGSNYMFNLLRDENSKIDESTMDSFQMIVNGYGERLSIEANKGKTILEEKGENSMKGIVIILVSYLNIMVLYFFSAIYGQSVAANIVMEKNSKLMENLLLSVKPAAVLLGKMLAVALGGMIQLSSWILMFFLGFFLGGMGAKAINPEANVLISDLWEMASTFMDGQLTPVGVVMAIVMALSGILLYASLASVGGSLAGKQEDLPAANLVFTLIVVACFVMTLSLGGLDGSLTSHSWMNFVPFTAVLIGPARMLLGGLQFWEGLLSIGIIWLTTLGLIVFSGQIYRGMVFYRGKLPSVKKILEIVKE